MSRRNSAKEAFILASEDSQDTQEQLSSLPRHLLPPGGVAENDMALSERCAARAEEGALNALPRRLSRPYTTVGKPVRDDVLTWMLHQGSAFKIDDCCSGSGTHNDVTGVSNYYWFGHYHRTGLTEVENTVTSKIETCPQPPQDASAKCLDIGLVAYRNAREIDLRGGVGVVLEFQGDDSSFIVAELN